MPRSTGGRRPERRTWRRAEVTLVLSPFMHALRAELIDNWRPVPPVLVVTTQSNRSPLFRLYPRRHPA